MTYRYDCYECNADVSSESRLQQPVLCEECSIDNAETEQRDAAINQLRDAVKLLDDSWTEAFGELERDKITGRLQLGKSFWKKKGCFVGGRVPYGWRSVDDPENPDHKIKVSHPEERRIIATLKVWISEGSTYQAFSNFMEEKGIIKNASVWHKIHKRES